MRRKLLNVFCLFVCFLGKIDTIETIVLGCTGLLGHVSAKIEAVVSKLSFLSIWRLPSVPSHLSHPFLFLAECSCHPAYVHTISHCIWGSCLLRGGCKQFLPGWAMPRGAYGREQGREAVTARKGTRRKRSVLTAASSLCTSEALVLGHKMTCCSCSSLPPSTTACSHCLHGLSYSSDALSALSACWYLVLATSRQSSTPLTSRKNAVSDGSTKCCSQEEIKANG